MGLTLLTSACGHGLRCASLLPAGIGPVATLRPAGCTSLDPSVVCLCRVQELADHDPCSFFVAITCAQGARACHTKVSITCADTAELVTVTHVQSARVFHAKLPFTRAKSAVLITVARVQGARACCD
eukprot:1136143-Pelagomonas_calceolata.AAC.3